MLGLLEKDRKSVYSAKIDLRIAYKNVRRDYSFYRYSFWELLSSLPSSEARRLLLLSFYIFKSLAHFKKP